MLARGADPSFAREFVASLRMFGGVPTPLLVSNYGTSELPQACCRLCAVEGGTYALRRGARALVSSAATGRCVGVVTTRGEFVRARRAVFLSAALYPPSHFSTPLITALVGTGEFPKSWFWLGVSESPYLPRKSDVCDAERETELDALRKRLFAVIPPGSVSGLNEAVYVRQLAEATRNGDNLIYVLHVEAVSQSDVHHALRYLGIFDGCESSKNASVSASSESEAAVELRGSHCGGSSETEIDFNSDIAQKRDMDFQWDATLLYSVDATASTTQIHCAKAGLHFVYRGAERVDRMINAGNAIAEARQLFSTVFPESSRADRSFWTGL